MSRDASGEPLPDPDYDRRLNYHFNVFMDGMFFDTLGAQTINGVRWMLDNITRLHAMPGRLMQVQIRNTLRDCWVWADGKEVPEGSDGLFNLENTGHAGSVNL